MITAICLTVLASMALADRPLVNLADGNPTVLKALFSSFQRENAREYKSAAEARLRLKNFRGFVHEMAQANDEDPDVEYGVTFFADLSEEEAQQYYGAGNLTDEAPEIIEEEEELEKRWGSSSVSHRSRYGSAKHQGSCGSCWAYATVGVVEGYAHVRTGRQHYLSEQEVLDCSGRSNSCSGGWHNQALGYIKQRNHLASGSSYRYAGRKGSCRYNSYSNAMPFRINGVHRASGDGGLLSALKSGPLGIAIDFSNIKIRGYYTGIWNGRCSGRVTHAITLVGYGSNYWDIRNSWGTGWGDRGYFKLSRARQNMCSIAGYAYYISTGSAGEEIEE